MRYHENVTIVVFNYNNADYIGDCLNSLRQVQSELGIRIIISDDYSNDLSRDILANESELCVNLNSKNMGLLAHVDFVLREKVSTRFAMMLGSDDFFNVPELINHLESIKFHPKKGIIDASANLINSYGELIGRNIYCSKEGSLRERYKNSRFFAPGRIVNRDLILLWKPYVGTCHTEDSVLLHRCYIKQLTYERSNKCILNYRKHDNSITQTVAKLESKSNTLRDLLNEEINNDVLQDKKYQDFKRLLSTRRYSKFSLLKSWLQKRIRF